jgi:hypothetical protein
MGLLWMGFSGIALFLLLLRIGLYHRRAWLGAILFLAHPSAAEMYGWASTRIDSMGATFGLLALWVGLKKTRYCTLVATFLLLLAFLSKESTYPLLLGTPLFFWVLFRRTPFHILGGPLAFGLTVGLKKILVGKVFPSWWSLSLPLGIRIKGWFLLAFPLILWPRGSFSAEPVLAKILAGIYATALILSLILPPFQKKSETEKKVRPLFAFGLLLILTLSITGGVPPRSDLGGGRVWFLPSAFFCSILALYGNRSLLSFSAPIGLGLLLLNLAPWSQARKKMEHVLNRLAIEVPQHERALEITNLEYQHGPVPLFYLMTEFYTISFHGPRFDRPLLMRKPQNLDEEAFQVKIEKRWLKYMAAQGRDILRLRWNPELGILENK